MIDAVEIINRFTEFRPWLGEEPLPLPIPGHWFRKICALADRIAAAENERDELRAELNSEIETATALGIYLDQAKAENDRLREALTKIARTTGRNGHTATNIIEFARAALEAK